MVSMYHAGAPAIDVHNHIRQGGLALEEAWRTERWHHRVFACIFGIIETNAFLARNFLGCGDAAQTHSDFTMKLAEQLIFNKWFGKAPVGQPAEGTPASEPVAAAAPSLNTEHKLVRLATLAQDANVSRSQRKCIVCSRVRKQQVKASFYCQPCGDRAVLCSPMTGRNCFSYHIVNGLPV